MTRAIPLLAFVLAACESITELPRRQELDAALSGSAVKPVAVSTTGEGTFSATLRISAGAAELDYSLDYSGLAGTADSVHLHGPAGADNVGGLLVDLAALPAGSTGTVQLGAVAGTASGTLDLRTAITATVSGDSLHVLLDAGVVYVDVHTSAHAGGELRGQIRKR